MSKPVVAARASELRPNQTVRESDSGSLRLVWIDCEMTGLDVNTKHLLEVACIITEGNSSLEIVAKGENLVIHQPENVLNEMDEWSAAQHGKSGLTEAVRNSTLTLEQAEEQLLQFVQRYTPEKMCPLAGNSCGQDRSFLRKYMPKLINHLHYRNVDVSSFKEMCRRLCPDVLSTRPPKIWGHRALEDIEDSRQELLHYIKHLFPDKKDSSGC